MSRADSDPSLSARRRAALRFDLEDRQIELIDELHGLADSLFGPLRMDASTADARQSVIAGTDDPHLHDRLRRLDGIRTVPYGARPPVRVQMRVSRVAL